ncbi:MAG: helix-turn-helix domain-containing protein, partial [Clostridiales bacterium]|nr:helix-turn-helix domain-containing protein [Clostridiales bacterium]
MEDKLLTVAQASKLAGVSVASIRRWTNSGKLKTYRSAGNHRRIKTSDL